MREVLFIRTNVQAATEVTIILKNLYLAGWHVVSHAENDGEYTFVLEGTT
jgi:hypothetical protein